MATKLSKTQTDRLTALSLPTTTADAAKKAVLAFLKKKEIEDVEDEDMDTLIEMAEAFADGDDEEEAEDEELEEADEEEVDEEEEEEEEEVVVAPKAKGKKVVLPEPDEDEDLDEAAEEAEEAAPKAIPAKAKKAAVIVAEDDEDEEVEVAAPAPKAAKAAKAAPVAKAVVEKPAKAAKAAPAAKAPAVRGERFDPENDEHLKLLKPLNKRFPKATHEHKMGKDGVTVRLSSIDSNNRALFVYNGLRVVNNELKGMMNFNALRMGGRDAQGVAHGEILVRKTFEDNDEILDRLVMEETLPKVKSATVAEVIEMIDALGEDMESKMKKLDAKLNKNREKLEENMKAGKNAAPKTPVAAVAAPAAKKKVAVAPVDEDEDEVVVAPKAKAKKAK